MSGAKYLFRYVRIAVLLFATFMYTPVYYVHSDYTAYHKHFDRLIKSHCPKIRYPNQFMVVPSTLDYWVLGVCHGGNSLIGIVRVSKEAWAELSESGKYELIFHELSHCVLNLNHSEDPRNYMYYSDTTLGKDKVIEQTIQSIKDYCNK